MGLWSGNLDRFVIFVYLNIPPYGRTWDSAIQPDLDTQLATED